MTTTTTPINPLALPPLQHAAGQPIPTARLLAPLAPLTLSTGHTTRVRGLNKAAASLADQVNTPGIPLSEKMEFAQRVVDECCFDVGRDVIDQLDIDELMVVVAYCTRQLEETRAVIGAELAAAADAEGNAAATATEETASPSRTARATSRSAGASPAPRGAVSAT